MESLTVHTADELVTRWEKRAESLLPTPGHTLAGSYDLGQGHAYRMAAVELRAILNEARRTIGEIAADTGSTPGEVARAILKGSTQ